MSFKGHCRKGKSIYKPATSSGMRDSIPENEVNRFTADSGVALPHRLAYIRDARTHAPPHTPAPARTAHTRTDASAHTHV